MYKLLTTKGQLIAIGIGLLSVLIAIGSIISGVKSQYNMSDDLNRIMKDNAEATFNFFNPAIYVVVILIAVAFIAAVLFGVFGLLSDPKGSLKFIIGFGLLLVLFFILYSTADVAHTGRMQMLVERFDVSQNVSKMITGGVKTAVIGIAVAFGAAVVMEIVNLFK